MADEPDPFRDIVGDELWRDAEKRARQDLARSRRRARLRLAVRKLPSVAVVLLLVGSTAWFLNGHPQDDLARVGNWVVPPSDPPAPTEDASDGRPPVSEQLAADPFTGTGAETFPPGTAGVVVPAAAPLGSHSAKEVAAALAQTARLIIAGRLDEKLLAARDGGPYTQGLAPNYRQKLFDEGMKTHRPPEGMTTLASDQTLLAAPRARGSMRAALGPHGELTVVTNYTFVYALKPSLPVQTPDDAIVVVRADATYTFNSDRRYAAGDRGAWLTVGHEFWSNISCKSLGENTLSLPQTADVGGVGESSGSARKQALDPTAPVPTESNCR